MKNRKLQVLLLLGLLASGTLRAQVQVPDVINYQGRISNDSGNHPGPTLQFKFALVSPNGATTFWSNDESSANGSEPSTSVTLDVADGLFLAPLGDISLPGMTRGVPSTAFDNRDVHLRIWVRDPHGAPTFEMLAPDVRLGSVGYAMISASVINGAIGPNKLANGAIIQDKIAGNAISGDKLKDNAVTSDKLANNSVDTRHLIDGSVRTEKLLDQAVTAEKLGPEVGVWSKSGNDITYSGGAVGIGTTLPAAPLHVVGDMVVEGADRVKLNARRVELGEATTASALSSTAMGYWATASGTASTAMGCLTTASGHFSTAMGYNTTASGHAALATGGGTTASGALSTAMGSETTASGDWATAMGKRTIASGTWAMALGNRSKANHYGAFVWADSEDAVFASTIPDQFSVRARGGVRLSDSTPSLSFGSQKRQMIDLHSNAYGIGVQDNTLYLRSNKRFSWFDGGVHADTENGCGAGGNWLMTLTAANGLNVNGAVTATTFAPSSDRNLKENFRAVRPSEVLDKVVALPITRWNFKADAATSHLGPMAQDFHAAFGLGVDDKHIATVDADGVALAAIQGLNQKLEAENAGLRARLTRLEELLPAALGKK